MLQPLKIFKQETLLTIFVFCNLFVFPNKVIVIEKKSELLNVSSFLSVLKDTTNTLSFEAVKHGNFTFSKHDVLNLGITKFTYWVKLEILNLSEEEKFLLNVSLPTLDKIEFYSPTDSGQYSSVKAGEQFSFFDRKYIDPDYLFDVYVPKQKKYVFYLKVSSTEGIQLPVTLGLPDAVFTNLKKRDILSGAYFGIMIAMILYNLFIYFSVRDRSYIYYVVYIALILITQTILQGYPFQYLWPNAPKFARISLFIFPSLVSIAGLEFLRNFLNLKNSSKLLNHITTLLYIPYLSSFVLAFLGYYHASFKTMEFGSMLVSVHMLTCSIFVLRKGYKPALFFLIGWVTFLSGIIIYILKDFEILPFNNFTRYTMQIGSAVETVLLSFALANRINILKRQNTEIIEQQNVILEKKVAERTFELEASNKSLKEAEAILVNTEKMASLGQLTAGISHEINNPINFVVSNIKPLKRDIQEILIILDKYNEIENSSNLKEKLEEVNTLKKKLDSNYLREEIYQLLKGIDEGANRTSEIVKGLKNFARTDEADLKRINIHESIEATLTLLNNSISENKIKIEKEFAQIPQVECYPGKINQVIMNLLSNAIDALRSKNNELKVITIKTNILEENIVIQITDNGIGIPQQIISKIFDPFYTTKDVGEGTGLGLSIVYGIIKSHNGKIEVQSEVNKNTTFTITLPVQQ